MVSFIKILVLIKTCAFCSNVCENKSLSFSIDTSLLFYFIMRRNNNCNKKLQNKPSKLFTSARVVRIISIIFCENLNALMHFSLIMTSVCLFSFVIANRCFGLALQDVFNRCFTDSFLKETRGK